MADRSGMFIVFEGIDGAGKSTQVRMLADALAASGKDVLVSREPTDGPWGRKLRASATSGRLPPEEELEAFMRDREEHLSGTVLPALEGGKVVIVDRYFYSTIAYQGLRGGNVAEIERRVRERAIAPDLVLLIDMPPERAADRIAARDGQPNEFERLDQLTQIRDIFLDLCGRDPVFRRVDGWGAPDEVHRAVRDAVGAFVSLTPAR